MKSTDKLYKYYSFQFHPWVQIIHDEEIENFSDDDDDESNEHQETSVEANPSNVSMNPFNNNASSLEFSLSGYGNG